jgi:hypothetical protein
MGGRSLESAPMLKRAVYWLVFLSVVIQGLALVAAALGEPAFLPAVPR